MLSIDWGKKLNKRTVSLLAALIVIVFVSFPIIQGFNAGIALAAYQPSPLQPPSIPPSMTLLAAGAKWAAQNGKSVLYIDWEDNYINHGTTDGATWGPWPNETDMKNWTDSVYYILTQEGFNVTLAGDFPSDLSHYKLLVIEAYWAVTPSNLEPVRNFIANGGGVVLLAGVPEMFRTYCKDWWTYWRQTDPLSVNEDQIFACDSNYVNTGGYANASIDNPLGTSLMAGSPIFEGTGYSYAAVADPELNGAQVIAEWNPGVYGIILPINLTVAFAYTYQNGSGRVYYQAGYTALDPPSKIPGDINNDGKVNIIDISMVARDFGRAKAG